MASAERSSLSFYDSSTIFLSYLNKLIFIYYLFIYLKPIFNLKKHSSSGLGSLRREKSSTSSIALHFGRACASQLLFTIYYPTNPGLE